MNRAFRHLVGQAFLHNIGILRMVKNGAPSVVDALLALDVSHCSKIVFIKQNKKLFHPVLPFNIMLSLDQA